MGSLGEPLIRAISTKKVYLSQCVSKGSVLDQNWIHELYSHKQEGREVKKLSVFFCLNIEAMT